LKTRPKVDQDKIEKNILQIVGSQNEGKYKPKCHRQRIDEFITGRKKNIQSVVVFLVGDDQFYHSAYTRFCYYTTGTQHRPR
jgi:hypothetical protein